MLSTPGTLPNLGPGYVHLPIPQPTPRRSKPEAVPSAPSTSGGEGTHQRASLFTSCPHPFPPPWCWLISSKGVDIPWEGDFFLVSRVRLVLPVATDIQPHQPRASSSSSQTSRQKARSSPSGNQVGNLTILQEVSKQERVVQMVASST